MESGVHSSLHQKCHHQIKYAKLNLKINYPPPYEREIWYYKYANNDLKQRTINYYPWEKSLAEKNVNENFYIFAKIIKNIFSNFIPHKTVLCDDRDSPWINIKTKKLMNEKNTAYQSHSQNGKNEQLFRVFQDIQNMLLSAI